MIEYIERLSRLWDPIGMNFDRHQFQHVFVKKTANNYIERTVERYPSKIFPYSKILKRLVANLKDYGSLKKEETLIQSWENWKNKIASKLLFS